MAHPRPFRPSASASASLPSVLASLALLASLAAGCGAPEHAEGGGAGTAPEWSASSDEIIAGDVENGHAAVAMLYIDDGANSGLCSGTLIDDRVYLTAAHCVSGGNGPDYYVMGGTNMVSGEPDWFIAATSVHEHPGYNPNTFDHDVGIVILSEDAPVKPYRWLDEDDGDVYAAGTDFLAVGYGASQGNGNGSGIKRKVDLTITEVYPNLFLYESGTQGENTCQGDSGGPALKVLGGYLTVIGVVSFGDQGCNELGGDMRTDDNASFIQGFASPKAGRAKVGGSGGRDPLGCSVAAPSPRSPLAAGLLAAAALAGAAVRRRQART